MTEQHHGQVYLVTSDKEQNWQVLPFVTLPGEVNDDWMTTTGQLWFDTSKGSVLLFQDGKLTMAPCL